MLRRSLLALVVFQVVASTGARAEETDKRVNWLREHALKVRSIDPQDEDFSDLEPLAAWIGDARVVQLGEQSHGDGAAFLAKARLVKFLHQKMGFDVLVWESGLLDCRIAQQAIDKKEPAPQAARLGVFPIWTMSEQVKPVLDYVQATQSSEKPIILAGCDCQFSSPSNDRRLSFLSEFFDGVDKQILTAERRKQLAELIEELNSGMGGKEQAPESLQVIKDLTVILENRVADFAKAHGEKESALMRRVLDNLVIYEGMRRDSGNRPEDTNRRDRAMGENLVWLANDYFAGRKLIVWAASFHLMRDAPGIKPVGKGINYDKTVPMGHVVHKALGKQVYTVAFLAHAGEAGNVFFNSWNLQAPPPGSLDDLLHRAGHKQAIVDLRSLPNKANGAWLNQDLIARPLGYGPMKARWPKHFDAFFFTDVMTPSTNPKLQARRAKANPLKPELLKTVRAVAGGDLQPLNKALAAGRGEISPLAEAMQQEMKSESIPLLIGMIEADNSYDTVYWIGHFGLGKLTGVEYSIFHDGAWWRRWWKANQDRFDESARKRPIPALIKTAHGRKYQPFPENVDTLDGKLALCGEVLAELDERRAGRFEGQRIPVSGFDTAVAAHADPRAIPSLIGMIEADNTYDTVYFLGYFTLGRLTGVSYSHYHDGAWWRRWWDANKQQFPQEVQALPIPSFKKTKHGQSYQPFPPEMTTLVGQLRVLEQKVKAQLVGNKRPDKAIEWVTIADDLADFNDPRAIPYLLGAMAADTSKETQSPISRYGLCRLTGQEYEESHDSAWWNTWWNEHKQEYPADVQAIAIPDFKSPLKFQWDKKPTAGTTSPDN